MYSIFKVVVTTCTLTYIYLEDYYYSTIYNHTEYTLLLLYYFLLANTILLQLLL